jgi:hypothetical protein
MVREQLQLRSNPWNLIAELVAENWVPFAGEVAVGAPERVASGVRMNIGARSVRNST